MDLSLPVLDGLAAARRIREHMPSSDVKIVAVSGHAEEDFGKEAVSAGCDEYLTKPFEFEQLEEILDRLLPGRR
jgi:CheY-like chemotaxis protein